MAVKKKKAQGTPLSAPREEGTASRLPFEPAQTRQKPPKQAAPSAVKPSAVKQSETTQAAAVQVKAEPKRPSTAASTIPDVVNRRMVSRAALFCGIPTVLALLTFVVSYLLIANDVVKPPTAAVLLVSLGFFGLGVLGLSYGPLSASWDEERSGNLLGLDEFKLNFGRLRDSWRAARAAKHD